MAAATSLIARDDVPLSSSTLARTVSFGISESS
jgi:hypothetical protein